MNDSKNNVIKESVDGLSFEKAYTGLEKAVITLRKEEISLEDSMEQFEVGMAYYEQCAKLLREAKGKVELYSKETDLLEAFES